jgi:hypothetical protein
MSNSILDRIEKTLTKLSTEHEVKMEGVFYGACTESKLSKWNYFVFNRARTTKNNTSRNDFQTFYQVHIIHEDYIPEGYVERVIEALTAKDEETGIKIRPTNDDVTYDYVFKGTTTMVVEMAHITVYRPEKRC